MDNRSPVSASSGGASPDTYQAQMPGTGSYNGSKGTYRHVPGHQSMVNNHSGYQQPYTNGMQHYPAPVPVQNGQYYAPPSGSNGYMPVNVYPPTPTGMHDGYYYYPPGGAWAMHGAPLPMYPQTGYGTSPPSTPPQAQMTYGYQMGQPGGEYYGQESRLLPPSPPHVNYSSHPPTATYPVPPLDNRRSSWSSSGASDSPATPMMPAMAVEPVVVGEPVIGHSFADRRARSLEQGKKNLEILISSGPPIPPAVPAVYSADTPKTMGQYLENPTNTTNVYIRGLPPDTTDDKLYDMTFRFGSVTSHKAIMDTEHGTCKGYGFARYSNQTEAENCIKGLVALKYEAGFARESFNARLKTLADPTSTNVYVSNLPRSMNEKDMQNIFPGYAVVSNRILRDANGNSRGVGFARFESREICDEVITKFHGVLVGEERLPLQVRYADTSAQKRLKATTTRKRQFRSHEYNSVVNGNYTGNYNGYTGNYYPGQGSHPQGMQYHQPTQFKNRVWLRQTSNTSSNDSSVALPTIDQNATAMTPSKKSWEKSQDWKTHGGENRISGDWRVTGWRGSQSASVTPEKSIKLETVDEDGDDGISETQSEVTTVPVALDGCSITRSHGTFSDPGDSYGGREMQ